MHNPFSFVVDEYKNAKECFHYEIHPTGYLSPGLVHVQRPKRLSRVADYGLLGIGQGLLRMKSGCQDTAGTEPLVAVSFRTGFLSVIVSLFLTGFLSVSFEVGGFISVSLIKLFCRLPHDGSVKEILGCCSPAPSVPPGLALYQAVLLLSSCSYSTSGSYSKERNIITWAVLLWTGDIGTFTKNTDFV